jgi:bifunctional non-homologous end joining protein LigD
MPLVLKQRPAPFDNPDWLVDLKYDGFRALLEIDGSEARLVSRNRNRFKHLDTLAAGLAKRLRVSDAILDGEVCCVDEAGRSSLISYAARSRVSSPSICSGSTAKTCDHCRLSSERSGSSAF